MALIGQTFNYTGDWQTFKVPPNVHNLFVTLVGGQSTNSFGGVVAGTAHVDPGDIVWVGVGGAGHGHSGKDGGGAAWPNGGKGGDGAPGRVGGDGGGGASVLMLNGIFGVPILAVAGGAGGGSGDGGAGGAPGWRQGGNGARADSSGNVATGGGQVHGGNGGKVPSDHTYDGDNAVDNAMARGGKGGGHGGTLTNGRVHGGGGGGGGYHSGGGGQAGKNGAFFGGGGGGGSNFVDNLSNITANGIAGTGGNGSIVIQWFEGGDAPPPAPSDVKINGEDPDDELPLHSNTMKITGTTTGELVHLFLQIATAAKGNPFAAGWTPDFEWPGSQEGNHQALVLTLEPNTRYRGKLYAQDFRGQLSPTALSIDVWTDRPPNPPTPTGPADDTEFDPTDTIEFTWTNSDPDADGTHPETPDAFGFRWREAASVFATTGPVIGPQQPSRWNESFFESAATLLDLPASTFPAGVYEWQVAARSGGQWSRWSTTSTFIVISVALPPIPIAPLDYVAIFTTEPVVFQWQFRTQTTGETQTTADIRYRLPTGDDDSWIVVTGDTVEPGVNPTWSFDPDTFAQDQAYEWQVRTHTTSDTTSGWSTSGFFYSIRPPGQQADFVPLDWTRVKETLGEGVNRVYLYKRGGQVKIGEITPLADVRWSRTRDDIGNCLVHVNEWNADSLGVLSSIKEWATELVVFRTVGGQTERVWEGPVVRVTDSTTNLEIEAKDVMGYVYRRIMRIGYNDSYQINAGQQVGMHTVVYRTERIIANALAYDDPNVLPFLTALHHASDAIQARIVKAYNKSAWQEIDDMAANAGLDYSVAGRRIILNDTHRPIGRLPEMSNGDFSDNPIVTSYGMTYATDFAVTNNNGVYGLATRGRDPAGGRHEFAPATDLLIGDAAETGYVEQIASQYGESDIAGTGTNSLTPAEIAALRQVLTAQADRNIANRYPIPVIVRVPDNVSVAADAPVAINQLIPGVWIPLRAKGVIREASQWQKLDSMSCSQDAKGERVTVVLSPAPNAGADPDADLDPEGGV